MVVYLQYNLKTNKMKKTLKIDGQLIEAKMFRTLIAATNYINKNGGEMVYFRAHEYYVSI